jgi:hypothetical protein
VAHHPSPLGSHSIGTTLAVIVLMAALVLGSAGLPARRGDAPEQRRPTFAPSRYLVARLNGARPIVHEGLFSAIGRPDDGENMNGPSVIRVPDWIPPEQRANPRARYYLYFAHHVGTYIRLAWAERIEGPWTLFPGSGPDARGVLDLGVRRVLPMAPGIELREYVASPDVHVDAAARRIVMYFHAPAAYRGEELPQRTHVALSPDGLRFAPGIVPVALGASYPRLFEHRGRSFQFAIGGALFGPPAADPIWTSPPNYDFRQNAWPRLATPFAGALAAPEFEGHRVRHVGVLARDARVEVFFTLVGATPETILLTDLDTSAPDPGDWRVTTPFEEVLRPEVAWEGADLPHAQSRSGQAPEAIHQMRDPRPFVDLDDAVYLFYTARGEDAIGVARLTRR